MYIYIWKETGEAAKAGWKEQLPPPLWDSFPFVSSPSCGAPTPFPPCLSSRALVYASVQGLDEAGRCHAHLWRLEQLSPGRKRRRCPVGIYGQNSLLCASHRDAVPALGWKQHPASSASKSGPHSLSGTEDADRRVSSRNRCGSTAPMRLGKTLGDMALPDSRIVVHVCRDLPA